MSWTALKRVFSDFKKSVHAGEADAALAQWEDFRRLAIASSEDPPVHLKAMLQHLRLLSEDRPKDQIRILDHGVGGGLTLLYLYANGYPQVHGVDIGGPIETFSAFLAEHFGFSPEQVQLYEGAILPYPDAYFDYVYSEQVLEHVRPHQIVHYLEEERRVTRNGAIVFHRVPQRLTPFESHTQRWLLHYMPRPLWLWALKASGVNTETARKALFLRWPWTHRSLVRRIFGNCDDRSLDRFLDVTDLDSFEGPRRLRKLVHDLLTFGPTRRPAGLVIGNLIMLDTISFPHGARANAQNGGETTPAMGH